MKNQEKDLTHIGKYTVLGILGQGGEGCVYLARDERLERMAAIKRVWESGEEAREGMKREAAFLQQLRHPMLPVVYDLLWDGAWYLVMEYIQGVSLHNYIKKNGRAGEEQAQRWAEQLLDILQYLHTRKPPVIYQDLKPENLILCPDGNLRLVDFGAAYFRNYIGSMAEKRAVSIGYGAPEQMPQSGKDMVSDERSDIYAFGKVMYYVLTGADPAYPPYTELPIASYAPEIRGDWEKVLRKCMQDNPQRRYQVAEEIEKDLKKCRKHPCRKAQGYRKRFVRHIEKSVLLTEKKSAGLMAL
ncbi:MAG: serine/threonine protein kinase [Lachnospiraceae bacterium]|nr:serine/threonine protein kinase [Lachnospiraceae bacterium]